MFKKAQNMDTFGFTQKKWLTLPPATRARHLLVWLTQVYQKLVTNRVSHDGLGLFAQQYNQILKWTDADVFIPPGSDLPKKWIEAVSDQIQRHRQKTGMPVKDHDLLEKIVTCDKASPASKVDIDCHVALDGFRSLFNVGSIFRICDAAGFSSLILGNTVGKEDPRVQKTAMGSTQWVNQESTPDLYTTLMEKKKRGYSIVGIETVENAIPFDKMDWKQNTIIVLGNEEYGISSHTLPACDAFVYIPMHGRKNSVNVACAASVICFAMAQALTARNKV